MLKQILAGVTIGAVGIGAGFVGGAVYKDKTIDVTQRDEYKQVVNDNNDLNTKLDATKLALANLTAQRDNLEAAKKNLETQLAAAQKQLSDKTAELETKQSELETADEQIRVLNAQIATLETDAEANATQITALQGQVATLTDTKTSLKADIADLNGQIQALNADIEDNTSEIENLTTALNTKTTELETLQAQYDEISQNNNELQNDINYLKHWRALGEFQTKQISLEGFVIGDGEGVSGDYVELRFENAGAAGKLLFPKFSIGGQEVDTYKTNDSGEVMTVVSECYTGNGVLYTIKCADWTAPMSVHVTPSILNYQLEEYGTGAKYYDINIVGLPLNGTTVDIGGIVETLNYGGEQ